METAEKLVSIYAARFSNFERRRYSVWKTLITKYFSRWIKPDAHILDLGCGYGEFINQVRAAKRLAMDLNPSTREKLDQDIVFLEQDCSTRWELLDNSLDLVFTSNFFEHLPDKTALNRTLAEALRCLKPGGCMIALGPNIGIINGRYWDFWDHYLPLTEKSLSEGLMLAGFEIEEAEARFLPYTMVGKPQYPLWTLSIYIRLPFFWRFFGEQFLIIARKPAA
jgi:SAM-dependent methyltransferase